MKKHGRTTEPITPQSIQGSNPPVNHSVEKEKRADYIENIADEDELTNLNKKPQVPTSEKSEQLKKEVNTRKPGEDVDPNQSLANE